MTRSRCARCPNTAVFVVSAGDPETFWFRSECVCLGCLFRSKRWAAFVGPVTVVSLDAPDSARQGSLFELPEAGR